MTTEWTHNLINPGAETGDLTGWTTDVGTPTIRTSTPAPNTGTYYFAGGVADADTKMSQEVDLVINGVPTAIIDNEIALFQVNWYQSSAAKVDSVAIRLNFKDSSKVDISETTSDLWATEDGVWTQRESRQAIPINTRYIDVIVHFNRGSGTENNGYIDDISCKTISMSVTDIVSTDFSEYAVGSAPSCWTGILGGDIADINITADKYLKIVNDSGSWDPLTVSWDDVGRVQDGIITVKWQPDAMGYFQILFRVAGTRDQSNYYSFGASNNSTVITRNGTELGTGTYPTGDRYYDITLSTTEWYYTKIMFIGSSIKAKIWKAGDSEPSFWPLDHTDTNITDPGYIGVGSYIYSLGTLVSEFQVFIYGETTLQAAPGEFEIIGSEITHNELIAGNGEFLVVEGNAVPDLDIVIESGEISITGTAVGFNRLQAESGSFLVTGPELFFGIGVGPEPDGVCVFYFTLTGANDGLPDVQIPISSFQARLRSGAATYLSLVIPGMAYSAQITARLNGVLKIDMAYITDISTMEEVNRETIIQANFDEIRVDKGAMSQSITLSGYKKKTYSAKTITLNGSNYRNTINGTLRYRFPVPNVYLNPGDTVTVGDDTFIANVISYSVSARTGGISTTMEVGED